MPRQPAPELLVGIAAVSVLLAGVVTVTDRPPPVAPLPPAAAPAVAPAVAPERGRPVGVAIADLGLDRPLVPLGRQADGALAVPTDYADVGVWSDGDTGDPVVLAGHVDSATGPAVFSRLAELAPGDEVVLQLDDGRRVRHVVERVEQHRKDAFPTFAVFAADGAGALRLVTCGGAFDRAEGAYRDNVVVYARAAAT